MLEAGLRDLPGARLPRALLAAAYRHQLHWTELIGGDVVLTIPMRGSGSSTTPASRSFRGWTSLCPSRCRGALRALADFRRAYDPDGITVDEFDSYGATVRTLREFIASYQELVAVMRDFMLPNPVRQGKASASSPGVRLRAN